MSKLELTEKGKYIDYQIVSRRMSVLLKDLAEVMSRHGVDNALHVPDFILGQYLVCALDSYCTLRGRTEAWKGGE